MIERECGLWKESVPEAERELWVSAAEASDEMVLKGLDGTLCGIVLVDSSWCFLEGDVLVVDVVFKQDATFVIKHV